MRDPITITGFTLPGPIGTPAREKAFNVKHRNDKHFMAEWALISLADGHCHATLRTYGTATGSANSACLWVNGHVPASATGAGAGEPFWTSGSGKAGGYGYHRPSQAAAEAFHNAGFTLSADIGGVGDTAIEGAFHALAAWLGLAAGKYVIHRAHP